MLVSLCGTPGTGKTTSCQVIPADEAHVIPMKDLFGSICPEAELDPASDSMLVDPDDLRTRLASMDWPVSDTAILEGHLSYLAPSDLCLMLRLNPDVLMDRLLARGYSEAKARENAEAEGVGTLQIWALQEERSRLAGRDPGELPPGCGMVLERDVTGMDSKGIADWMLDMMRSYRKKELMPLLRYRPGIVDWMEVLSDWY